MTPTHFLRERYIVSENKKDLIINFDNGTKESLAELLESYYEEKLKRDKKYYIVRSVMMSKGFGRTSSDPYNVHILEVNKRTSPIEAFDEAQEKFLVDNKSFVSKIVEFTLIE